MEYISYKDVDLLDGFWKERYYLNADSSIPNIIKRFTDSRFKAVKFLFTKDEINTHGRAYDSDVAKLIEGISYILYKEREKYKEYEELCDDLIDAFCKNSMEDGYFNSYYQVLLPDKIFTKRVDHELYNLGHLIEAAIAYHEATGKDKLLNMVIKYVDLVNKKFKEEGSVFFVTPGHEEIELALFKLYTYTKNEKYYELASFFLEKRGNNDKDVYEDFGNNRYAQDNEKIRDLVSVEGHAVRAMYLYDAMAKYCKINKDKKVLGALRVLYSDLMTKQYITGAIGSYRVGEIFTIPYDLPNLTAYSESCASIGEMMFLYDLYDIDCKKEYHDVIERILYNGFLSSTSLDGKAFFYENPLEIRRKDINKETSVIEYWRQKLPITQRVELFECSCCPPNIARFISSIGKYIFAKGKKEMYINQFISAKTSNELCDISLISDYPRKFSFKVCINAKDKMKINVRYPDYVENVSINGDKAKYLGIKNGYMSFEINKGQCEIEINFAVSYRLMEANAKNPFDQNKVALMYGPIVYCLEEKDNGEELNSLFVEGKEVKVKYSKEYGMNVFKLSGFRKESGKASYSSSYKYKKETLTFIPYYCFANRGESDMLVWINKR